MNDGRNIWKTCFSSLCSIFLATVILSSCSEDPTLLNSPDPSSFIHTDVIIRDTTLQAVADSTFKKVLPMNSRQLIVGRFGNYVAMSVMEFIGLPVRDTVQILSARLRLRSVSWFGNSTGSVGFTIHRISKGWSPATLDWDTVSAAGFYEETPLRGTYSGTILSDSEYIFIDLDTAMVRQWLVSDTSSVSKKYGIALVPNAGINLARGFANFASSDSGKYFPRLEIIARGPNASAPDTTRDSLGFGTFAGNIDNLNSNPAFIYAQAGVVYRSTLKFDLSAIPRGATVASAELLLERDPQTSQLNKFTLDSVVSVHVLVSDTLTSEISSSNGRRKAGTSYTFSFDVRHAAQSWIRGPNYGLLLRVYDEFNNLDLYTFNGRRAADQTKRPRINIKYVVQR
jgi:hypothetical protein